MDDFKMIFEQIVLMAMIFLQFFPFAAFLFRVCCAMEKTDLL